MKKSIQINIYSRYFISKVIYRILYFLILPCQQFRFYKYYLTLRRFGAHNL
jgi:hypothetical protein